ncbi:MAG: iron ABC transporter permease [Pseudomonadota bacterium]|jgi:iron complex transport system permease protein
MPRLLPVALLLLAPFSLAAGIMAGSAEFSPSQIAAALGGQSASPAYDIVWQLRLPRVLAAFACGGLLALTGVLLQVLLRNPLADPYILGVSGGAAAGSLGAMLFGLSLAWIDMAALAGAATAIGLVFALSFGRGGWSMHHLLLTGVVLSAGFGALISLMLTLAPTTEVRGMLFWLMGDLSQAQAPGLAWSALLAAAAAAFWQAPSLNVLGLGELKAKSLGVALLPLQIGIYLVASTAAAVAVLEGGSIGFVGLIVPHLLRLAGASDHRWLVPLSALAGGSFLTLADTLARTAAAPLQLPVGVLTALLGVPLLLTLLARNR